MHWKAARDLRQKALTKLLKQDVLDKIDKSIENAAKSGLDFVKIQVETDHLKNYEHRLTTITAYTEFYKSQCFKVSHYPDSAGNTYLMISWV